MGSPIRVLILDGDDSFRQRLCTWLEAAGDIVVVSEAKEGREAIALIHETGPGVVLLDASASRADSLPTVGEICELFPQIKTIVLNDDCAEQLALEAFGKGALGYLSKEVRPDELVAAVRIVARGKAVLSPSAAGRILDEIVKRGDIA